MFSILDILFLLLCDSSRVNIYSMIYLQIRFLIVLSISVLVVIVNIFKVIFNFVRTFRNFILKHMRKCRTMSDAIRTPFKLWEPGIWDANFTPFNLTSKKFEVCPASSSTLIYTFRYLHTIVFPSPFPAAVLFFYRF